MSGRGKVTRHDLEFLRYLLHHGISTIVPKAFMNLPESEDQKSDDSVMFIFACLEWFLRTRPGYDEVTMHIYSKRASVVRRQQVH